MQGTLTSLYLHFITLPDINAVEIGGVQINLSIDIEKKKGIFFFPLNKLD